MTGMVRYPGSSSLVRLKLPPARSGPSGEVEKLIMPRGGVMETLGSRLALLPVRFRPPHPLLVCLLLCLLVTPCSAAGESDPLSYYSLSEIMSADAGIMPLDFGNADSINLANIAGNTKSAASYLSDIKYAIGSDSHTIFYYLGQLTTANVNSMNYLNTIKSALTGSNHTLLWFIEDMHEGMLQDSATFADMLKALQAIQASSASANWPTVSGNVGYWSSGDVIQATDMPFSEAMRQMLWEVLSGVYNPYFDYRLGTDGSVQRHDGKSLSLLRLLNDDLVGLAVRLTGNLVGSDQLTTFSFAHLGNSSLDETLTANNLLDALGIVGNRMHADFNLLRSGLSGTDTATIFSFLNEDITTGSKSYAVNNVLDALGMIGTQLQNPLQRLAYVFANPLDLEIRENVTENQEAANENFFKPGSPGSVSGGNIKDAAGFTTVATDFLETGGSVSDAFAQLGQGSENWGFFSQAAMDDMLGSPPPSARDDYMGELGEDGLYHLLPSHLYEVDSALGKGGK